LPYFASSFISKEIFSVYIEHYLHWHNHNIHRDGQLLATVEAAAVTDIPLKVYEQSGVSYPKFFKMDLLSRTAFLATELLAPVFDGIDKKRIAVALSSSSGCLDVDKKYDESRKILASPALFVYTLPNIMLGEICIRHGFKGEQMTTITEQPDTDWMLFYVNDLLDKRQCDACLLGHAEATEQGIQATLLWVSKTPKDKPIAEFNKHTLEGIFQQGIKS
jgi:hypothetical protein